MLDPKLSQLDGGPKEYPPSLWHALKPKFEQDPSAPAVFALHQASDHLVELTRDDKHVNGHTNGKQADFLEWSFQQLNTASTRIAAAIYKRGIKPEACQVTFIPNGVEWCLLNVASMKAKLNYTALDLGALEAPRADELNYFLDLLRPELIVVADVEAAKVIDDAEFHRQPILKLLIQADKTPQGWLTLAELAAESDAASEAAVVKEASVQDHERICVTMFTSGTSSGRPKGVPRNVVSMLHQLDHTERVWDEGLSRRLVDTANFRAIAQGHALCSWYEGGAFVMSGRTASPAGAIKAIDKVKVTDTIFIPAMVRMIRDHPEYTPEKVASVRTCATGGDVVTRAVLQLIESTFPNAKGTNAHGMTETAKFFRYLAYLDGDGKGEPRFHGDVVACGLIAPGTKLKVVLDGAIVPRSSPGELEVGSYHTARKYLQSVSPETFYKDAEGGWMKTGDVAVIDKEGYIYIVGRSKDVIKRAGIPVVPSALESALAPYVNTEAVVFGIDHPVYGAEPWAVLGNLNGKTEADIKQHILDKFGKDYALGGAVSLADLNLTAMPLNATGKIVKLDLKKALEAYLAAKE